MFTYYCYSISLIEQLMDHRNERKKCVEEWGIFQKNVVDPILALDNCRFSEEEIQRMTGILNINSVSVGSQGGQQVSGRALYPTLSLTGHSCVANASYQGISAHLHPP